MHWIRLILAVGLVLSLGWVGVVLVIVMYLLVGAMRRRTT